MEAFNIFKSKKHKNERVLTAEEYYIGLGNRAKTATVAVAVALALMIIFAFSAYSDDLTVDNMRYMLKFINTDNATVTENDVISFDFDTGNKGKILSGNLAVYNSSGLTFYDNSGEKIQTDTFRTDSAASAVGGKHLFYYDMGGNELRVYTPYQQVYIENFAYPILGVAASDSNYFAVISSVKGYRSAVMIYNSYFKVIYTRKFGEYYVNSVDISSSGKKFATAVMYSENGRINAGVYLFSVDEEQPVSYSSYPGEIPLAVKYLDGGYALITDAALRFYDEEGNMLSHTDISGLGMTGYVFGDGVCSLFCGTKGLSTGCRMLCVGTDGRTVAEHTFEELPIDRTFADGKLYVLTYGRLYCFDMSDGSNTVSEVDENYRSLVADRDMLLLFSNDSAVIFKTFEKEERT